MTGLASISATITEFLADPRNDEHRRLAQGVVGDADLLRGFPSSW